MSKPIEQAIVRIQNSEGRVFGAGFLVSCNQILTCAHVVADSLKIPRETQELPDLTVLLDFPLLEKKSLSSLSIVRYWDPKSDIALLEILEDAPEGAIPIELAEVNDYSYCNFGVCGFPNDIGDWTYGKMLGKTELGYIQVEAETAHRIQGGYSGGPVWHRDEEKLAGMVVASDEDLPKDKIAYIIPVSTLLNALPHYLKKTSQSPAPLMYACFISFPVDSINSLIRTAAQEIQEDLEFEISAQLKNKSVLANTTRTARELCESACMIMLYTYRYFDSDDPLCAQEFHAMSLLEQTRLQELNVRSTKETSFIIPIVIRGIDKFPKEIDASHPVYDFVKYFMLSSGERRRRRDYRKDIEEIARHIVGQCKRLEQNIHNPCGNCADFELPKEQDVQHLIRNLAPNWVF